MPGADLEGKFRVYLFILFIYSDLFALVTSIKYDNLINCNLYEQNFNLYQIQYAI